MRRRIDRFSLYAGAIVTAFGLVLLLDQSGDVDLSAGAFAAIATAAFGLILLLSGLIEDR